MNWPYIHTLINHFPIILVVMGTVAAIAAAATGWRGLWLYAVGSLTFAALVIYPVFLTGDEADHYLHNPWYIMRGVIDSHEEAAELTLWIVLILGLIAAFTWWRLLKWTPTDALPAWLRALVVIGSIAATVSIGYTSLLGGRIIHDAPILTLPEPPAGTPASAIRQSMPRPPRAPLNPPAVP